MHKSSCREDIYTYIGYRDTKSQKKETFRIARFSRIFLSFIFQTFSLIVLTPFLLYRRNNIMNKETHDQNIYIHIPKTENDERNRDRYYGLSPLDGNVEIHRVMVIRSRQFHSPNLFLSRRHCCNLLLFYAIRFAARRRTTSPILVFVFLFSYRSRARAARSEWGSKSSLRASRTKWRPVSRKPFAGCRSIPAALPCSFPEYAIDN